MDPYLTQVTAHSDTPAKVINISTDGSPRWLRIVRDVAHIAACLCVVAAFLFAVLVFERTGDALDDWEKSSTQVPCELVPDDPNCIPGE